MARNKGILPFSGNFEPQISGPFDARTNVPTYAELVLAATWTAKDGNVYSPYGLQVLVDGDTEANNGVYWLTPGSDYTVAANWKKRSGGGIVPDNVVTFSGATPTVAVGDSAFGGTVVFVENHEDGSQTGLVVALDRVVNKQWSPLLTGMPTTLDAYGSGQNNTNAIIAMYGTGDYAAKYCADLVIGDYVNWFLPSTDESFKVLDYLRNNGTSAVYIWTSVTDEGREDWAYIAQADEAPSGEFTTSNASKTSVHPVYPCAYFTIPVNSGLPEDGEIVLFEGATGTKVKRSGKKLSEFGTSGSYEKLTPLTASSLTAFDRMDLEGVYNVTGGITGRLEVTPTFIDSILVSTLQYYYTASGFRRRRIMVSDPQTYPAFEFGYDAESTAKSSKNRTLYTSGENWTDVVANVVFEEGNYIIIDADDAINRPAVLPVPGHTENQYNCSLIGNDALNIVNRTLKMHLVGTERNFTWDLDNGTLTEDASGSGAVTADSVSNAISEYTQSTPEAVKELVLANKQLLLISDLQEFFAGAFAALAHNHDDRYDASGTAQSLITQLKDGASSSGDTLKRLEDRLIAAEAILGSAAGDGDALLNTVRELLALFSSFPDGLDMVTLLAAKVNTSDIFNALDCITSGKALDARQGKVLFDAISALQTTLSNKVDKNGTDRLMTQAEGTKLAGLSLSTYQVVTLSKTSWDANLRQTKTITGISNKKIFAFALSDSTNNFTEAAACMTRIVEDLSTGDNLVFKVEVIPDTDLKIKIEIRD